MNKTTFYCLSVLILCRFSPVIAKSQPDKTADLSEELKKSLVYLEVSARVYNQTQPWRQGDVTQRFGYGCAVGEYEVITTAWNAANAVYIKARRHSQNEFIPARIKVIDYESNLCLLELDKGAMQGPLEKIRFAEVYEKGAELRCYWLSSGAHLTTARGYLDRAEVNQLTTSYTMFLEYVAANTTSGQGRGRLFCMGEQPIGLACWFSENNQETGIIPAERINQFLTDARQTNYQGFATAGFAAETLLDPTMRAYLKMPEAMKHGVHVSKVFNLGTGKDALEKNDVILAIDTEQLNPYGRYKHKDFDRVNYHHLLSKHRPGETVIFDLWRNGEQKKLAVPAENFSANDMLVPCHEHEYGPQYIVTAGFVFQKLTRDYLTIWGDDWSGKVPPHLYHYYRDYAFNPTDERKEIVILSYVLPADINLGYQQLGRLVVKKFNGKTITKLSDILDVQNSNPDSRYETVEFEQNNPVVVIDKNNLEPANISISQAYGINPMSNIQE